MPSGLRNLLLTMLLGGLWHGAAWTFVAWGALHGLYLVLERLTVARLSPTMRTNWVFQWIYGLITLAGVLLAWVLFRAEDFPAAWRMLGAMSGFSNAIVDAEFFAGTTLKSNFLLNLGYADESALFQKLPRFPFDKACRFL